jgi:hypothetical protein
VFLALCTLVQSGPREKNAIPADDDILYIPDVLDRRATSLPWWASGTSSILGSKRFIQFQKRQGTVDVEANGIQIPLWQKVLSSQHERIEGTTLNSTASISARNVTISDNLRTMQSSQNTLQFHSKRQQQYPDSLNLATSVSLDPFSTLRLLQTVLAGTFAASRAAWGTLQFLAPLVVARRGLRTVAELAYQQPNHGHRIAAPQPTSVHRLHYTVAHHNDDDRIETALRSSAGRILAQMFLSYAVGYIMEWMIGLDDASCGNHSAWWCNGLWIAAVAWVGHVGATAIALWGGPMRIFAPSTMLAEERTLPIFRAISSAILKLIKDPNRFVQEIAAIRRGRAQVKPIHINKFLFPATYKPLKLLSFLAVAREMTSDRATMRAVMRLLILQQAFGDEWHRVLLCEMSDTLGIAAMTGFFLGSFGIFAMIVSSSSVSTILVLPYFVSVAISGWMTAYTFIERHKATKEPVNDNLRIVPRPIRHMRIKSIKG